MPQVTRHRTPPEPLFAEIKMNKEKIGRYIEYATLAGLLGFLAFLIGGLIKPSKKVGEILFSSSLFAASIGAILTGEVGIKAGSIKKQENPKGYWFMVFLYFVLAGFMFLAYLFEKE